MDGIFDGVIEQLKNQKVEFRRNIMGNLLRNAVKTGKETLEVSEKDDIFSEKYINEINNKYGWKIKPGGRNRGITSGFILQEAEHQTVVDWAGIREYVKEKTEETVIKELFQK